MKKSFITFLMLMAAVVSKADPQWAIMWGSDESIEVSKVNSVLHTPQTTEFHILTTDGQTIGPLTQVKFGLQDTGSVPTTLDDSKNTVIEINGRNILIYCPAAQTSATLTNLDGVTLLSQHCSDGSMTLDCNHLEAGVYILTINSISYKIALR